MNENQSSLDREMKNANYLNEEKSKQLEKDVKFWKENSQKLES